MTKPPPFIDLVSAVYHLHVKIMKGICHVSLAVGIITGEGTQASVFCKIWLFLSAMYLSILE